MRDEKFFVVARSTLINFTGFVELVGDLVVDEDLGGPISLHPVVNEGFEGRFGEWVLSKQKARLTQYFKKTGQKRL